MKVTSADRERAAMLMVVGIMFLSWFGGARILNQKATGIEEEIAVLEEEYNRRQNVLGREEAYINESEEYTRFYEEILKGFPENITEEGQLLFAAELEREFKLQISSISFLEPFEVASLSVPSENGRERVLMCYPVQFPIHLERGEWKRFMEFVAKYPEKSRIAEAEGRIDEATGALDGSVTIYRYGIAEREQEKTDTEQEDR